MWLECSTPCAGGESALVRCGYVIIRRRFDWCSFYIVASDPTTHQVDRLVHAGAIGNFPQPRVGGAKSRPSSRRSPGFHIPAPQVPARRSKPKISSGSRRDPITFPGERSGWLTRFDPSPTNQRGVPQTSRRVLPAVSQSGRCGCDSRHTSRRSVTRTQCVTPPYRRAVGGSTTRSRAIVIDGSPRCERVYCAVTANRSKSICARVFKKQLDGRLI